MLYETDNNIPLLKLAWNRLDPNYVAVISMEKNYVTLLDTRFQSEFYLFIYFLEFL